MVLDTRCVASIIQVEISLESVFIFLGTRNSYIIYHMSYILHHSTMYQDFIYDGINCTICHMSNIIYDIISYCQSSYRIAMFAVFRLYNFGSPVVKLHLIPYCCYNSDSIDITLRPLHLLLLHFPSFRD